MWHTRDSRTPRCTWVCSRRSVAVQCYGRKTRHSERATPAAIALQLEPERKRGIMIGQKSRSVPLGPTRRRRSWVIPAKAVWGQCTSRLYVQVDVLSPTSRAGREALTSAPWPIGGFIVNPIQPRRSASAPARLSAPDPNRRKSTFAGTVHQHRCAAPPLTSPTAAAPCLCWQTLPDRLSA